jgi:hypothetical protein
MQLDGKTSQTSPKRVMDSSTTKRHKESEHLDNRSQQAYAAFDDLYDNYQIDII